MWCDLLISIIAPSSYTLNKKEHGVIRANRMQMSHNIIPCKHKNAHKKWRRSNSFIYLNQELKDDIICIETSSLPSWSPSSLALLAPALTWCTCCSIWNALDTLTLCAHLVDRQLTALQKTYPQHHDKHPQSWLLHNPKQHPPQLGLNSKSTTLFATNQMTQCRQI